MPPNRRRCAGDVGHGQSRIRWSLDKHEREIGSLGDGAVKRLTISTGYATRDEPKRFDYLMNQMLTAAVERLRVDKRAASLEQRQEDGRDGGHPGIEYGGSLSA